MMNGISAVVGRVAPAGHSDAPGSKDPAQTETFGVAMLLALLSSQTTPAPMGHSIPPGNLSARQQGESGNAARPATTSRSGSEKAAAPGPRALEQRCVRVAPAVVAPFPSAVPKSASPKAVQRAAGLNPAGGGDSAPRRTNPPVPGTVGPPAPSRVTANAPAGRGPLAQTVSADDAPPWGAPPAVGAPGKQTWSGGVLAGPALSSRATRQPSVDETAQLAAAKWVELKPASESPAGAARPELAAQVEVLEVKPRPHLEAGQIIARPVRGKKGPPACSTEPGARERGARPAAESLKAIAAASTANFAEPAPAPIARAPMLSHSAGGPSLPQVQHEVLVDPDTRSRGNKSAAGVRSGRTARSGLVTSQTRLQSIETEAAAERGKRPVRSAGPAAEPEQGSAEPAGTMEKGSPGSRAVAPDGSPHLMVARPGMSPERPGGSQPGSLPLKTDQPVQAPRSEQPAARPSPIDRVTVKFTDSDGVEGRLRVAVRGQAVRATIVSENETVARRLEAHIGELQQTLDHQGFRESQIAVQHVRRGAELGSLAVGTAARIAADASATPSRGLEEHGSRERTPYDQREQQGSGNGRSQQRPRHREER
jgi:hypothetical protein